MEDSRMPLASKHAAPGGATLYRLFVLGLAVSLCGNLVIRLGARGGWLSSSGQVVVALAAAVPLAVAAILFGRLLRGTLDEMFQRIVLEGLAFALIVYVPLAAAYMNLRAASAWVPRLDPADVLLTPALLVAIGVAIASRRYA
jgi:hypothetical protein